MSNERETLADIAYDLRGRADCAERHGDRETHNDGVAMFLRSIADRIEAIDSADAWRSLYTPGNAAAMREGLEKIRVIAKTFMDATRMRRVTDSARIDVGDIEDLANAALSAPARNCDRPECKDIYSAMQVYRRECCVDAGPCFERRPGAMREADWLLAPAAERKGEGDGR